LKIGLISDTHDNIRNIEAATKIFVERGIGLIIHAGDITTPEAVEAFCDSIKVIGVLGNNDVDVKGLTDAFQRINGELRGDFCEIKQDSLLIAIYHGTNFKRRESIIQSGKYDIVIYGHTHKTENKMVGKTRVINPGTANGWFLGYKATATIFDTITKEYEFVGLW
jgi:putative phosphoesterase